MNDLAKRDDHFDPEERVGRSVTNAFGIKEVVILKHIHWLYLDWLETRGGRIEEYIIECDKSNPKCSLSFALEAWVCWLFEDRKAAGLTLPQWLDEDGQYNSDN